jgi:8-oxo-dGTP diphosphatase
MKFQFSAGGIVFKKDPNPQILVSQHSQHHGWVFPKGLIGDKEENKSQTKEETAIREVREETGADAKILRALTPVTYWFVFEEEKIKKTVYYFIMEFMGGDITKHDHEMENVEWIDVDLVEKRLTYPSDKKVWKEARELI